MKLQEAPLVICKNIAKVVLNPHKVLYQVPVKKTNTKSVKLFCYFPCLKIKNATFPYKTALPEANITANRMGSKKWTYYKECNF